jgi:uncharacterized protein (DUF1697 family)
MPTWVALLRGINLGRTNKIEMSDLRDMLEGLGCKHVRTHLQSGNAIFTATGKARELERKIAGRIKRDVGLEIKVMIRSAAELAKTVRDNPMSRAKGAEKELQVAFLSAQPTAAKVRSLAPEAYAPDEFHVGKRGHLPPAAEWFPRLAPAELGEGARCGCHGQNLEDGHSPPRACRISSAYCPAADPYSQVKPSLSASRSQTSVPVTRTGPV